MIEHLKMITYYTDLGLVWTPFAFLRGDYTGPVYLIVDTSTCQVYRYTWHL